MIIKAIIERGTDGSYDIHFDSEEASVVPFSLLGQGKSVKEAIRDFYESRDELKNHYNELNREFPDIEFHFKYDMASFLEYYSGVLTLAGLERLTGINQGQLSHYVTGHRKPSAKTVLKIEQSIHSFSKELSQVNFV
ncbi:MAG: helix-turn-helix transcriptional regulator [Bacteroidales bacterium]|nr:helix-turn-helix transcriptional regulator [Eubacteriales bacterium]MDD4670014.1 helix-turn-helix transcriptional regulator [Bacteroidales bacterium]